MAALSLSQLQAEAVAAEPADCAYNVGEAYLALCPELRTLGEYLNRQVADLVKPLQRSIASIFADALGPYIEFERRRRWARSIRERTAGKCQQQPRARSSRRSKALRGAARRASARSGSSGDDDGHHHRFCAVCGEPIPDFDPETGRKVRSDREYCFGQACTQSAYRARQAGVSPVVPQAKRERPECLPLDLPLDATAADIKAHIQALAEQRLLLWGTWNGDNYAAVAANVAKVEGRLLAAWDRFRAADADERQLSSQPGRLQGLAA